MIMMPIQVLKEMFGAPYHSIVCHMSKLFWIVSLRSIVTETSEHIFHELKFVQTLRIAVPTPQTEMKTIAEPYNNMATTIV